MSLLGFVVFIIIVGFAAIYFEDAWQTRLSASDQQSAGKSEGDNAPSSGSASDGGAADEDAEAGFFSRSRMRRALNGLTERVQGVGSLLPSTNPSPETIAAFRQWTETDATLEPELRVWLRSLSENQFSAFTHHVSDFCRSVGLELAWLVQGDLAPHAELADQARQIVGHYCRSCHQAAAAQRELIAFQTYQDYAQHPQRRQKFGEHLLDELLRLDLTTISMESYLTASKEQRQKQIKQAIEEARARAPERFLTIVADVLQPAETAESAAKSTPESLADSEFVADEAEPVTWAESAVSGEANQQAQHQQAQEESISNPASSSQGSGT